MIQTTDLETYGKHLAEQAHKAETARIAAQAEASRLTTMEKHIRNARYALDNLLDCMRQIHEDAVEDDAADEATEASFVDRLRATGAVVDPNPTQLRRPFLHDDDDLGS